MSVKTEAPPRISPPKEEKLLPIGTRQLLKEKLKAVFGYASFRGCQEKVIQNVLRGKDVFVIMPTGAGKSLCYQLPPLLDKRGTTLIISPLIALMKNQVDQLRARGISAYFLNSTLGKRHTNEIKEKAIHGEACLLYISPECFCKEDNIVFFKRIPLGLVAIDESHCISEWGHDFRPKYRLIRPVLKQMKQVPVMALTASATPKVQADICKNLELEKATVFMTSFNRKNLYYQVLAKWKDNGGIKNNDENKKVPPSICQLITYVHKYHKHKQMGIVYCLTRKTVEIVTFHLRKNSIKALPYHAGLDAKTREKNQDAFLDEEVQVIVATIAFGMGIDKPNIRFVIHYDSPKSIESYYQETGRAGRDGKESLCLMLFNPKDENRIERMYRGKAPTERENAITLFKEIIAYARSPLCRRKNILQHFGETYKASSCGYCDNCQNPTPSYEAMPLLLLVLRAVEELQAHHDISDIAKHLSGIHNARVQQHNPLVFKTFAKGKEQDVVFWSSVIRQAISYGFILRNHSVCKEHEILALAKKGKDYLRAPHPIHFFEEHAFDPTAPFQVEKGMPKIRRGIQKDKDCDKKLLHLLKKLQKTVAQEKGLPPYIIFHPSSLQKMAMIYPRTTKELSQIHGVGTGKVERFGKPFLQLITQYVDKHKIIPTPHLVIKSSGKHAQLKKHIIRHIDHRVHLEEIMQSLSISFQELIKEIENICRAGSKLDLDPYLDQTLDKEQQEEIYDYFLHSKADNVEDALRAFDDCPEEGIRLMRVKFMSELGS